MIEKLRQYLLEANKMFLAGCSFERSERFYLEALKVIRSASDRQDDFSSLIISMFANQEVDDESIAYLMYVLRWEQIYAWAQREIETMELPILHAGPYQNIIDAYDENWEGVEIYPHILEERQKQKAIPGTPY